ncbi:putative ABC transporter permease [Clostridium lacusfryxellense]|uniref:putative ABC transporter permease n=1 Tax=Clostridium lacusfryxellense TaxID=205328 RepID=UPI001C0C0D7D|nr:putative ABC transporter permease [Clostridium lacusfryxellense]MBU3110702.1 putative ABC transporter permease [Clostridium lacusfryxellense]
MWKKFVIYGCLGLLAEVLWTGLGSMLKGDVLLRGTTCIWMFPIYGLAIFLEPVHYRIKHLPLIVRGGTYMVLIFAVELVSGLLLRLVLGECPWNYVNRTLSIFGIITLSYAPVWFAYGIMLEQVHDIIMRIERSISSNAN